MWGGPTHLPVREDGSLHGVAEIWGRVGGNSAEHETFPCLRSAWEHTEGLPGMGQSAVGTSGVSQTRGDGKGLWGHRARRWKRCMVVSVPLCRVVPKCHCFTGDRAVLPVSPCRCEVGAGGVGMWLGPLLHPKGPRVVRSSWGLCHGGVPRGRGHRLSPTRRDALGEDGDAAPTNWVRGEARLGGERRLFLCTELLWQTPKGKLRAGPGVANSAQPDGCFQYSGQEAASQHRKTLLMQ